MGDRVEEEVKALRDEVAVLRSLMGTKLQGRHVSATKPAAADVFKWNQDTRKWEPESPSTAVAHTLDSTHHTDVNSITEAQGMVLYLNGTPKWVALSPGAANKFLMTGGAGANPSWVAALKADGTIPLTGVQVGVTPTDSAHLVTKEYVDSAIHFIEDYFFNDTPSSYGGTYYKMLDTPTGEGESTFQSGSLGQGDNQEIFNFATDAGIPGLTLLEAGVYAGHIHARVTAANKRPVKLHFGIYERTNGTENLRATSEETDFLTTSNIEYVLHATMPADVTINTTDRLIIKWFANVDSTPASNATVELFAEGNNASRLSVPITTDVLSQVFLRQDGTKPLTGDWDAGAFQITLSGDSKKLILGAGSDGELYSSGDDVHLHNVTQDADLVLGINDGGVSKTITWDASEDKLKHSAGVFAFDDVITALAGAFTVLDTANLVALAVNQLDATNNKQAITIFMNTGVDSDALFIDHHGNGSAINIDSEADTAPGILAAFKAGYSGDMIRLTRSGEKFAVDENGNVSIAGNVASGTWQATDVGIAYGGTARSSHTAYAVICGGTGATTAQQSIASVGTAGQVLTSNGAGALPTMQAAAGATFTNYASVWALGGS